jgi:hypothetical protein
MSRDVLIGLVAVLAIGVAVLGYSLYQEKKQPDGVEITVGRDGVSIQKQ